jgi:hypothetical protein
MTVKEFVEDGLREGLITILVSPDVKWAFGAVLWPSILKPLKDLTAREIYITFPKVTPVKELQ